MGEPRPSLDATERSGVPLLTDRGARRRGIGVAFTGRRGGISAPPFAWLNVAAAVGDDTAAVEQNRARAARSAGFEAGLLALTRQVHGAGVLEVGPGDSGVVGEADVLVTHASGPVLGILTADCAPIVIEGTRGVAVAHAGWRGLVAGVVEAAVDAVDGPVSAWVGPSVHACCYVVGPGVVDEFRARSLPVAGPDRVDPGRAAAADLHRCGVERVTVSGDCTSCNPAYFSFRRDGRTGRQGAFAWLIEDALP